MTTPAKRRDDLTPRQRRLLQLIAAGNNLKTAADTLGIHANTAMFHRNAILYKLNSGSVEGAIRKARERGQI